MQPLNSYLLASVLALPLLVSYTCAQADTPEVVFDCSVTPSVCTNMCWGAYCSNYEVSLEFDNPSTATKNQRRTKAGCKPNPNRCSGGDPNGSCDEYPFASTSNADDVQQVTRCVPGSENSSKFKPYLQSLFFCTNHSWPHFRFIQSIKLFSVQMCLSCTVLFLYWSISAPKPNVAFAVFFA